jgi:hypothetical protein
MTVPAADLGLSPELFRWLRADPAWSGLPWSYRWRRGWQAWWGGVNWRLSRPVAEEAALPAPWLIAGPWRSGTTLMHELLHAACGGITPRTWQCMNACAFQLGGRGADPARVTARPMDGLPVTADSPQEDEFALLTLGVDSAYRAFLMPHRLPALQHTLDPEYWSRDHHWLTTWEAFLRGVVHAAGPGASAPLILKSPNHTYRLPALIQRHPKAKVLWMVRSPVDVFHSNRRMWTAMFDLYGCTRSTPQDLDAFIGLALQRAAAMLTWCLRELPDDQLFVMDFEQLSQAPAACTEAVVQHWTAGPPADAGRLAAAIERLRVAPGQPYEAPVPASVLPAVRELENAHRAALARR